MGHTITFLIWHIFIQGTRFKCQSSKDIMKWQIDMAGSLHVGYCCSYIYGQILVVHPSECNQLSCSYTLLFSMVTEEKTAKCNTYYYSL